MATKSKTRARRTKSEVQNEFQGLQEERQGQQPNSKIDELSRMRDLEIKEAVKSVTVDNIVHKLSGLGIEVTRSLSEISGRLVEQMELLASIQEAVKIEEKELARIHNIDIAQTALDDLIEEYTQAKEKFEEERLRTQAEWEQEKEQRERETKETEENLKKFRAREREEFEYQRANERKKDQDKYLEEQKILERKNKEKQESLEKSWGEREASNKAREEEFQRLSKEVETFPNRLAQAVEKSSNEIKLELERKNKQDLILTQKDSESEKRLAELKIKSLEDSVVRQFNEIEFLKEKLEEAKKQVQDIAVRAIEGASGARALNHINQIAMEQAKTRTSQT